MPRKTGCLVSFEGKKRAKKPSKMPEPPGFLTPYAVEEWNRILPALRDTGLLVSVDFSTVAAYCQCYGRWREAEEQLGASSVLVKTPSGNVVPNPLINVANTAMKAMTSHAKDLGFTPSARPKVFGKNVCDQDALISMFEGDDA